MYYRQKVTSAVYRVIQEERSILWEVTVSAIVSKKVLTNMCPILNGYGDTAIEIKKLQDIHISILNVKNKGKQIIAKLVMRQHIINLQ